MSARDSLRLGVDFVRLAIGALAYARGAGTPPAAYQALVRLFCRTSGRSNDVLARLLASIRSSGAPTHAVGVLGDLGDGRAEALAAEIGRTGYARFPSRLSSAACDRLLELACDAPCTMRGADGSREDVPRYERAAPRGPRYDVDQERVLADPEVQALIADESILALARAYLRATPIIDVVSMWWHSRFGDGPSVDAGQLFHFDLDRIRWLKFFVYLTDVGPENGPHEFVVGSHRTGALPPELLRRGYARLSDEDVRRAMPEATVVAFTAPRGTIIAEDTRGLHKGRRVASGDRLMLQLQYSNSGFGAGYPPMIVRSPGPALERAWRTSPRTFSLCRRSPA